MENEEFDYMAYVDNDTAEQGDSLINCLDLDQPAEYYEGI